MTVSGRTKLTFIDMARDDPLVNFYTAGHLMAQYVMPLNWTEQGIKTATQSIKRAAAAKQAFEKSGAKIRECFWTLGQYDLMLIVEAPSDEVVAALGIQLGMLGNMKSCTIRAFGSARWKGF
jgi:uncharacterized protein with GYD domain